MQLDNLISTAHLSTAIISLATGAVVLLAKKGTRLHKRMGYAFAIALFMTNLTAAGLYNLTGSFNFLHVFIVISMLSLAYGLWPVIRRKSGNWYSQHVRGMTGASLGVWAAGLAELFIRVMPGMFSPKQIIWFAIGIGVLFFFLIGFANYHFMKKDPLQSSRQDLG